MGAGRGGRIGAGWVVLAFRMCEQRWAQSNEEGCLYEVAGISEP